MKKKLSLAVVVCLFLILTASAQTAVSVSEEKSSIRINQKTADVSISVLNRGENFDGVIALEILDEKNLPRTKFSQTHRIKKGENIYKTSLPLGNLLQNADDKITWYRLHYTVGESSGFISLSELIKDFFDLRVAASDNFFPGQNYRIRVRALEPFTKSAVKNVKIEGELELDIDTDEDDDELKLKAETETDGEGFAVLNFMIPTDVKFEDDGEWKITGRKYGLVREIEEDLDSDEKKNSVFITIDKPMYQPGQSFNARGLLLDQSNTVVTGGELEFQIKDEDGTTLYREKVKTSAFGIASVSWKIPDNAKLGTYRVEIENDDGDDVGEQNFKVSRYDLPNFSVAAKPDKTFYLPENKMAEITVSADYLFGKPVTKGRVRVVQESDRSWNYRKQKYDADEKNPVEGATDADGKFIAKFDLTEEQENLKYSGWQRFRDLHFAAYYTDLTTNRTEQKRFDVRLTREPIHVYLVGNNNRNPKLPFTAYVSTFYADGTPAVCDVQVSGAGKTIQNLKTNALGAGKIEFDFSDEILKNNNFYFKISARDKNNQSGTFEENFYFNDQDAVKIELEKTIFKPGENLKINVVSSKKDGFVYLDILRDLTVVESRFVRIENGRGIVKIPYNLNFKGKLTVAVYDDENACYYYYDSGRMRASRGIVFPEQQNLKLDADFSAASYKPGEEAKVKFSIFDGAGKSAESALGVVVFDKAIEERARTDAEFGSYFSRFYSLLGYSESFGGITLKDLNDLDLSKNISPEIQLAAEIMLAGNNHYPRIYHSGYNETEPKNVYAEFFKKQLDPVENILKKQYQANFEYPSDEKSLREILSGNSVDFDKLRDPWGNLYVPVFSVQTAQDILTLNCSGADKKAGTKDDFAVSSLSFAYFTPTGQKIGKALREYQKRTGKFVRDLPTLSAALAEQDFDPGKLKDRWNRDYRIEFKVTGRNYQIVFSSAGADGTFGWRNYNTDDFDVWTNTTDYFSQIDFAVNKILSQNVNNGKRPFPTDEAEFKKILKENDLDFSTVTDGYGNPAYLAFDKKPRYANRISYENGVQKITPVTEEVSTFYVKSKGANQTDERDDFVLTTYSGVVNERSKETKYQIKNVKTVSFSGANGAIRGTVFDPIGAVVPNAAVTATNENDAAKVFSTNSNDEGMFLLENLPSGIYTIKILSPGFSSSIYTNVEVRSQNLIEITVTLNVGGVSETVDVTSDVQLTIDSTDTKIDTTVTNQLVSELPKGTQFSSLLKLSKNKNEGNFQMEENSTPRLREYFPETLVWTPELLTDKNGRAEMKFKMADNITTWKMYTIASTKNGKIGVAEKEVQAFQPFFVDLEPPKFLTDGDEIFLPAQIRNYTDKKQKTDVSMARSDWFSFLNSERQQIEIAPNASENAVFGFRADAAVKNGKQKVTAIAGKESDAIEKTVTVKPNGQEVVKTESKLFTGAANFDINFPADALPKTPSAEVKIYPNLFSHVTESVEGLLIRPYGCGEQTISSTYPNLMILKFTKEENKLRKTAQNYLQKGYERLLGYQISNGGISYWGEKSEADIALTAYAIRFLNDARGFIAVDESVVQNAIGWLVSQQRADGSFTKSYYYEKSEDARRTKMFTAYVARILAMTKFENGSRQANVEEALRKALAYLKTRNGEIDEPYSLALFGLASFDAGNISDAKTITAKLETMAIAENETVYWNLETNTPFYGWGTPGRIETTALAIQLMTKVQSAKSEDLISKGTMFLLKNKDRYGVWYSTQTTINVLDAFLATLAKNQSAASAQNAVQVLLNGEIVQNFAVASDQIAPLTFDLKEKLNASENRLEIKTSTNSPVMTQIVQTHYVDWRDAGISNLNMNESRLLSLEYKCDRQTAEIMQEISCEVETERIGFQGYGMLLAEIGIPPGADVSRESLQAAMDADWTLSRYDILPDRIIFYMWSKPGGTKFNFKFRPRYGINANTPASVVYDYYNDEAKATIAPLKFTVK